MIIQEVEEDLSENGGDRIDSDMEKAQKSMAYEKIRNLVDLDDNNSSGPQIP